MNYFEAGISLIKRFKENGYEAYFVGGVVRDYLLNYPFHDIDITTNAKPDEINQLFIDTYQKGIKYNSVVIKYEGYEFETTTYRYDVEYVDHRHPLVKYAEKLEFDLARRDFTINAMAMDDMLNVVDLYNGKLDIENKIIKCVNDPYQRFEEDALRMLRACYFSGKLNFKIEEETLKAIENKASTITLISSERILQEMKKLISSKYPLNGYYYLVKSNLANYLPGLKDGLDYIVDNKLVINDFILFFALCFSYSKEVLEFYKFPNSIKNKLKAIIELTYATEDGNFNTLLLYSYGKECSLYANAVNVLLGKHNDKSAEIIKNYDALPIKKTCDLKFKGQDIMILSNKSQASWIGDVVDKIKYEVLMNNLENDYDKIKEFVLRNHLLD